MLVRGRAARLQEYVALVMLKARDCSRASFLYLYVLRKIIVIVPYQGPEIPLNAIRIYNAQLNMCFNPEFRSWIRLIPFNENPSYRIERFPARYFVQFMYVLNDSAVKIS